MPMPVFSITDGARFLNVMNLAADQHRYQKRKAGKKSEQIPYINHPIDVANRISLAVTIDDEFIIENSTDWLEPTLLASLIHDAFEDTYLDEEYAISLAGKDAVSIALEVTDDDTITYPDTASRKAAQAKKAETFSLGATNLKIADQTSNLNSIIILRPKWDKDKITAYRDGATLIVESTPKVYRLPSLVQSFYDVVEQLNKTFDLE